MENTYLDPEATLKRINNMKDQAQKIHSDIDHSRDIMEDLKKGFEGASADRLQSRYNKLAETFDDLLKFLQSKAEMMSDLTTNIKKTDES